MRNVKQKFRGQGPVPILIVRNLHVKQLPHCLVLRKLWPYALNPALHNLSLSASIQLACISPTPAFEPEGQALCHPHVCTLEPHLMIPHVLKVTKAWSHKLERWDQRGVKNSQTTADYISTNIWIIFLNKSKDTNNRRNSTPCLNVDMEGGISIPPLNHPNHQQNLNSPTKTLACLAPPQGLAKINAEHSIVLTQSKNQAPNHFKKLNWVSPTFRGRRNTCPMTDPHRRPHLISATHTQNRDINGPQRQATWTLS